MSIKDLFSLYGESKINLTDLNQQWSVPLHNFLENKDFNMFAIFAIFLTHINDYLKIKAGTVKSADIMSKPMVQTITYANVVNDKIMDYFNISWGIYHKNKIIDKIVIMKYAHGHETNPTTTTIDKINFRCYNFTDDHVVFTQRQILWFEKIFDIQLPFRVPKSYKYEQAINDYRRKKLLAAVF